MTSCDALAWASGPAAAERERPAPLFLAQHAIDRGARRAGETGDLLLGQRERHGRCRVVATVGRGEVEQPEAHPRLGVDVVGLDDTFGESPHLLCEQRDEYAVDPRVLECVGAAQRGTQEAWPLL